MGAEKLEELINDLEKYQAHIKEDASGKIIERETLMEHTKRTEKYFQTIWKQKEIAGILKRVVSDFENLYSEEMFNFLQSMIMDIPVFHDLGKINVSFQKYVMNNSNKFEKDNLGRIISTQHSIVSSILYLDYYREVIKKSSLEKKEKKYLRLFVLLNAYIISRHHSNLSDFEDYTKKICSCGIDVLNEFANGKVKDYLGQITLNQSGLKRMIESIQKLVEEFSTENDITLYVYTKLIYSLLVAADYYATSEFMSGVKVNTYGDMDKIDQWNTSYEHTELLKKIRKFQKDHYPMSDTELQHTNDINVLRTEMFCEAEETILQYLNENIFYLEAPTGSGKSNVALNLTFQLIKKNKELKKVFYIYPFNTLVEQNISNLNKIFGEEKIFDDIAVINSLTPIKMDWKKMKNEEQEESGTYYQKALLNRQFLNYPMILSTHVTLFDTLFGDSKDSVFGFHQLCNSVIVLDEIQSYRNDLWGEIVCFLKQFAPLLNMKIIIMSATLPDLDLLSDQMMPAIRLLKDRKRYFEHPCFKNRVSISYELLEYNKEDICDVLYEKIKQDAFDQKKVLIEFITKKTAEQFFRLLKADAQLSSKTEYISGDDSIVERNKILKKIEQSDQGIILVSTQVIEAGVDIDMDVGYKNISKLDSEEQFMGRINRSCKKPNSKVYFFKIDDSRKIYGSNERRTENKYTLENHEIRDILIKKDFQTYYSEILKVMKNVCYNNVNEGLEPFFKDTVGNLNFPDITKKMTLIEDQSRRISVYLARNIKNELGEEINGALLWREYSELLKDYSMEYAEKKVKLSKITSLMNCFIYQIENNSDLIYNDRIGELFYIEDGEQFFEDGKFNRESIQNRNFI